MEKYRNNNSASMNASFPITNRFLNTGPLYTMCGSNNLQQQQQQQQQQQPQLLMNTTSVGTSTKFQFVPARHSSTYFTGPFQFEMGSITPIFNSVKTFFSNLMWPKVDAETMSTAEKRKCNSTPNIYMDIISDRKCVGDFDKNCFVDVTNSEMMAKLSSSTKSFSDFNLPVSTVKSNNCCSPRTQEDTRKVDVCSSFDEATSHTAKETNVEKSPVAVVNSFPTPVPVPQLQMTKKNNFSVMPNVPIRPSWRKCHAGKRTMKEKSRKSTKSGKNKKEKDRHELSLKINEDVETENETMSADEWDEPLVIISAASVEPTATVSSNVVCFSKDDFPAMPASTNKQTWELPRLSHCFSSLKPKKQRQISECDSEDSFIIFDDKVTSSSVESNQSICDRIRSTLSGGRQRQLSECSDDDFIVFEVENSDSDSDSDSEDDEDAELPSDSDCESEVDGKSSGTNPPDSGFEEKKVRFNLNPVVHVLRTWSFAYQQARKGEWEQIGRDRARFRERVKRMEPILLPTLNPNHRQKIYGERFSGNCGDDVQKQ